MMIDEARRLRVAVTGASGYIGRHLTAHFIARGIDVTAISRRPMVNVPLGATNLVVASYDAIEVDRGLEGADYVIHLAAEADRHAYSRDTIDDAAMLAGNLALSAKRHGARAFVAASSIYASSHGTLYGQSKRHMENALLARPDMPTIVILRLPPVYGSGGKGLVNRLIRWASAGVPLPLACARHPRRMLGLENVLNLFTHIVCATSLRPGIYHPADVPAMSLGELARAAARKAETSSRLFPMPFVDKLSAATLIDAHDAACHAKAVVEGLGWAPPTTADPLPRSTTG